MRGPASLPALIAGRVVRRGKYWTLEPLFADLREFPISRSGKAPHADDVVLAVPVKGNRVQIVEVLGTTAELSAVLKALLHARGIRQGVSDAQRDEAGEVAAVDRGDAVAAPRRDLAGLPTFTIDPDTARDFDDAISVERLGAGSGGAKRSEAVDVSRPEGDTAGDAAAGDGYRAWVHIADVSHFVVPGGAIDAEARQRTASVYLPLWAEPMLPEELSAGVCSLKPHEPRKCVTVEFTFSTEGVRRSVAFYRSTIHSDHRLTYGFVDEVLRGHPDTGLGPVPTVTPKAAAGTTETSRSEPDADRGALRDHLLLAAELAGKLRRARFARGALQIGSFEPEFRFDARGRLIGADERPESPSHSLVEEFMLAANEAVAQFLQRRKADALYRVHEAPDPASADGLLHALEELEVPTPPFPDRESATAGDVAGALRHISEMLPKLSAREGRGRLAFPQLLLRSLKQARYDRENLGHFGLSSDSYLHFTSPIRRYPDLVVHRALLREIGQEDEAGERGAAAADEQPGGRRRGSRGDAAELGAAELYDVAAHCSTMERTIAKVELTADDVALAFLLHDRLYEGGWDQVFRGEIIGVIESGVFVHFGESFEGYLPARSLPGEYYSISPWGTALVGQRSGRRFRLGDPVLVCVERVDRLAGKVELSLAASAGAEGGAGESGEPARRLASAERTVRATNVHHRRQKRRAR